MSAAPVHGRRNLPERSAARLEIRKLLEDAIRALPEAFRVVFIMREVMNISIEETAALLRIRSETVKARLHRARRLLRASLEDRLSSTLRRPFRSPEHDALAYCESAGATRHARISVIDELVAGAGTPRAWCNR
jgi:hypothetical protein